MIMIMIVFLGQDREACTLIQFHTYNSKINYAYQDTQ